MKFLLATSLLLPLAVTAQICEICGCSTCPQGFRVGQPDVILMIPEEIRDLTFGLSQIPCGTLESLGLEGNIPNEYCNDELRLRDDFRTGCACPPVPAPVTSSPTMAPVSSPPTVAPVLAATAMPVSGTVVPTTMMATPGPTMISTSDATMMDIDTPITAFILVHAPTNTELLTINDKDVIDLEALDVDSAEFNIKVVVDEKVRSVYFEQTERPEGTAPFAFCGDEGGDYFTCDEILIGKKTKVTVTPYTGDYQTGMQLPSQSISFKIMSSERNTNEKNGGRDDKGEGSHTAPAPVSAPVAYPTDSNCPLTPLLGKVELLMIVLNDRIAKKGFPAIHLDFVSGDTDNDSCAIDIHFGMKLETRLLKNNVELEGKGVLAGIAVKDGTWCVNNLSVTEFDFVDGPAANVMLQLVEEHVFKKTVSEILTDALEDRIEDFCI